MVNYRVLLQIGIGMLMLATWCLPWNVARAEETPLEARPQTFYRAQVISVADETAENGRTVQKIVLELQEGEEAGRMIEIDQTLPDSGTENVRVSEGDRVVVIQSPDPITGQQTYFISDRYRIPTMLWITALFFGFVLFFTRKRGMFAIFGLAVSLAVLVWYVVPQIAEGKSPLWIGFSGALGIGVVSMLLAHGWNKRTRIALSGTLVTLVFALGLSWVFVKTSHLLGFGSEEVIYVQLMFGGNIEVQGLLLAGIVVAVLGVLDDITTSLTASIEEIHHANPRLPKAELYRRGLSVGREHILSLVNTLVLAYAGASLPLLLLFTVIEQPLWVTFNSEFVAEEIIRTLVGSFTLVLAVPITAYLAAGRYHLIRDRATNRATPLPDPNVTHASLERQKQEDQIITRK